jgi:hypothetical protein
MKAHISGTTGILTVLDTVSEWPTSRQKRNRFSPSAVTASGTRLGVYIVASGRAAGKRESVVHAGLPEPQAYQVGELCPDDDL